MDCEFKPVQNRTANKKACIKMIQAYKIRYKTYFASGSKSIDTEFIQYRL
jgi:hypothetical protein